MHVGASGAGPGQTPFGPTNCAQIPANIQENTILVYRDCFLFSLLPFALCLLTFLCGSAALSADLLPASASAASTRRTPAKPSEAATASTSAKATSTPSVPSASSAAGQERY